MKKIIMVFGTRPEAIKMAPLIHELKNNPNFKLIICVTGQHKEMLKQVLDEFGITPDYDLGIMKQNQTLVDVTVRSIEGLNDILKQEEPDLLLVHGDTTTTFAGGLMAFYNKIAVGHVEAGLRTGDKHSPFPEEMNRLLVGRLADLHFAPTSDSMMNLVKENIHVDTIYTTGNTAIDALKLTVKEDYTNPILDDITNKRIILMTMHRRENLGEPMERTFKAVRKFINHDKRYALVFPVHMNPKIRELAYEILGNHPRIKLIEPLDTIDFHNMINKSYLILTDSGGVQEEAPSLGKPVLVLRDTTERPEGVRAGTLKLIGTNPETIISELIKLSNRGEYITMARASNPYGDGMASKRIVEAIEYYFGLRNDRPELFKA